MTGRDRMVLIVVAVVAALGAAWVLVVSPESERASKLGAQVAAARTKLAGAESQAANARQAQAQYAAAYASVVSLGKAVPASQEVPSLIYQLTRASNEKDVDFSSITAGSSSSGSSSSTAPSEAGSSAAAAGFSELPFTFVFEGSFFDLEHLFRRLADFTTVDHTGALQVNGRLLTIQGVSLAPQSGSESGKGTSDLTGSITATAYVLPTGQGLTGSASAASPTGAGAGTSAASSTTTAPASSATAPAIVRVNP
jgi:Tfp pilus assembly protein PilO